MSPMVAVAKNALLSTLLRNRPRMKSRRLDTQSEYMTFLTVHSPLLLIATLRKKKPLDI